MNLPEYSLNEVHHDLLMERLKVDILIHATNDDGSKFGDNTDFVRGINEHLLDLSDRLQILCDRLELIDLKIGETGGAQ